MLDKYMNSLIRNIGKSYKDIYSQTTKDDCGIISRNYQKISKDLINKYIGIEKKVLNDTKYHEMVGIPEDYDIPFHSQNRYSYEGKATLEFDDTYPVIHLISYATDVADYNIQTHNLVMGNNYSPTTTAQMEDFSCLFDFSDLNADHGQGKLVKNKILGGYEYQGTAPTWLLSYKSTDMNNISTLDQVHVFNKLFINVYKYSKSHKLFKYQLFQIGQLIVSIANHSDTYLTIQNETNTNVIEKEAKQDLEKIVDDLKSKDKKLDLYSTLVNEVDVNNYWDDKDNMLIERNIDNSYDVLMKCIKKTVNELNKAKVA